MKQPNLFTYAPNELSQDAIIAYLIEWAHSENALINPKMQKLGLLFVQKLIDEKITIHQLRIRKQYLNTDILAFLNEEKILLIEDKVNAREGEGQLARYKKSIEEKYPNYRLYPVYLKTGDQGSFSGIKEAGYEIFLRRQFLEILKGEIDLGIENQIVLDFYEHLKNIEESVESFRNRPVSEWFDDGWRPWKGFFTDLQQRLGGGDWSYIAQRNGGFLGFWFSWGERNTPSGLPYHRYLQLEFGKFCFKISCHQVPSQSDRYTIRDHFRGLLFPAAKQAGLPIKKNGRIGKTMTTAILDITFPVEKPDGTLDMDGTLEVIQKVQNMMKQL